MEINVVISSLPYYVKPLFKKKTNLKEVRYSRRGQNVRKVEALDYVHGDTTAHDVLARD